MRLGLTVSIVAGLLVMWSPVAQADTPPAAPIFYCPTPGKADPPPTAAPAKSAPRRGHVIHASAHHRHGCPTIQAAAAHHRWRHRAAAPPKAIASNDVSASQAFIYRYERAVHGLDARAADQAWAEGRHPPCPHPCPQPDGWRHPGQPDARAYAEGPPPPPAPERRLPPPPRPPPPLQWSPLPAPPLPAPPPPPQAYAWQDGHSGYRYDERDQESERTGGWRFSEIDGRGHLERWGDRFADEPGLDRRDDGRRDGGERQWAAPRYRCPPPVPASSCTAGPDAPVRHSDVDVAGRDAAGYLTWPGKTE